MILMRQIDFYIEVDNRQLWLKSFFNIVGTGNHSEALHSCAPPLRCLKGSGLRDDHHHRRTLGVLGEHPAVLAETETEKWKIITDDDDPYR